VSPSFTEIKKFARHIAEMFKPEKIILFGSFANGKQNGNSDVDILVVKPFKGKSVRKACEILEKVPTTLRVDLLVRSPQELRKRLKLNDYFLADIMNNGKTLHEASR
jgi:predicted nucleotidyltransferase